MNSLSPKWRKWRELAIVSFFYAITFSPPFIFEWHADYSGLYFRYSSKISYGIDTALIIILVSISLACLTQYCHRWERFVFSALLILLSIIGITATAHIFVYDAPISVGAIDALLGSDLHEALEYASLQITPKLSGILISYFILNVVAFFWVRPRLKPELPCPATHGFAYSIIAILVLLTYQNPGFIVSNPVPKELQNFFSRAAILNAQVPSLRMMEDVNQWLEYREWLKKNEDSRALYNYHASLKDSSIQKDKISRIVVLVLGESMRRGNLSLYGYDKNTTPKMEARRNEFLIFNQAVAPANQTIPSVTKLLSPATVKDPDRFMTQPSIISAAKQAGYKTYWLSNQGRVGHFDSMISLFAHEADSTIYTNTEFYGTIFDEALLAPFSSILQESESLKFIVLHIQGSHQSYKQRYQDEYKIFNEQHYQRPELKKYQREFLAEYDNTIRHTDAWLEKVLVQLEQHSNSTLLFLSDHGERFFEAGVDSCGHGYPNPSKTEVEVPYFIWCQNGCKPEWQEAHTQHKNTVFSTENLFYTAINILGLSMQDDIPSLDILNTSYNFSEPLVLTTDQRVLRYVDLP